MYTPRHFTMPAELQARILAAPGVGDLVTHGPGGLAATHLPYLFDPSWASRAAWCCTWPGPTRSGATR